MLKIFKRLLAIPVDYSNILDITMMGTEESTVTFISSQPTKKDCENAGKIIHMVNGELPFQIES